LEGIPAGDWLGALSLSITQWSPYSNTGRYIVFGATGAMVWVWDHDKVEEKILLHQLPAATTVIPEPLFYAPLVDGVRLLQVKEGFDAQVWMAGELLESVSLSVAPTERQIKILQASFPAVDMAALNVPLEQPFTEEVWGKNRALKEVKLPQQAWIVIGGSAAIYFVVLSWQLLNIALLMFTASDIKQEIARYKAQIGEVIDARESAYKDAERVSYLNTYLNSVPQTQVLAGILDKIPRNGTILERWLYQEGDLAFTVKGQNFDPRYYVQAFESLTYISSVSTQTDQARGRLTIKAKVAPEEIELSDMKP
jgi:hypothetical protein